MALGCDHNSSSVGIPTEPIGSIPRPSALIEAIAQAGDISNPRLDTPEEERDRILEASDFIPLDHLHTTDDCGFSPFSDVTSTTRERHSRRFALAFKALGWPKKS